MFHTMFVGLVLSQLCLNLNLSEVQIGLVNAIPNIVLPVQLISAYLVLKHIPRKPFFIILGIISRLFMVLISVLLMIDMNEQMKIAWFMLFLLGFHISFAMGVPLWFSWMSDIVPKEDSAHFFGNRNVVAFISGMIYILLFGILMDKVDLNFALTAILGASGLCSFVELWIYRNIPSGEVKSDETLQFNWFFEPFKHREFSRFIALGVAFNGALFLVMPFFFIYFKNLGYSSLWIQSGMALNAIGAAVGSKVWAFWENRIGNQGILKGSVYLKMMSLAIYGLVDQTTPIFLLAIIFFIDGWAMGGWFTGSFSILTSEMPRRNSSIIMAWFFSIIGLSAFCTSFLSGIWMDYWANEGNLTVWFGRDPFQALCWISACIFPLGLIYFKGYRSIREV